MVKIITKNENKQYRAQKAWGKYLGDTFYIYEDEDNKPIFRVVRKQYECGKKIHQEHLDKDGNWIKGLKGVKPTIYHLPEVLQAVENNETVFIVEGEKDVETLRAWGLAGTTNPMGAGKWKDSYNAYLKDANVVIIPDNDEIGLKHAEGIAARLLEIARTVKLVKLPVTKEHEDVTNWMERYNGTKEQLLKLVEETPSYIQTIKKIYIKLGRTEENSIPAYADKVCEALNKETLDKVGPDKVRCFYWKDGTSKNGLGKVLFDHSGNPTFSLMTRDEIFNAMCKVAYSNKKTGVPPKEISSYIYGMAAEEVIFSPLSRIIQIPVFSSDGELINRPGYYAKDRLLYIPYNKTPIQVSQNPTEEEIKEAKELLENDILVDFDLKQADKAHAIAYFLLFFCREMIPGPTPLHIFEAAKQGTGKTLLAESIMKTLTLGNYMIISKPSDEEEFRKKITTALLSNVSGFCLDNVETLKSTLLAQVLLTQKFTDRLLGSNVQIGTKIKWIWAATGNNIVMDDEILRRSIRIRLNCDVPEPHRRPMESFKHPFLHKWCEATRDRIAWAGLTIIQAWIAAGRPMLKTFNYGGFETWSQTIGNILYFIEVPGFLENMDEFYEEANAEAASWQEFVSGWWKVFGNKQVTAGDLLEGVPEIENTYLGKDDRPAMKKNFLSHILRNKQDTVTKIEDGGVKNLKLKHEGRSRAGVMWALKPVIPQVKIYDHKDDTLPEDTQKCDECDDCDGISPTSEKNDRKNNVDIKIWEQGEKPSQSSPSSHTVVEENDVVLSSTTALAELKSRIFQKPVVLDIETSGLNPHKDCICVLSLACGDDYWIVGHPSAELLKDVLESAGLLVGHNLKFDLSFIRHAIQKRIAPKIFDTMLAAQLIEGNRNNTIRGFYSLQGVAQRYLAITLDKSLQTSNWSGRIMQAQIEYCINDVKIPLRLYEKQRELLERNGLLQVAELEFDCVPAVVEMELNGVAFDTLRAEELLKEIEAVNVGSFCFNPGSHEQIKQYFESISINLPDTKEETLATIDHPMARQILAFRDKSKQLNFLNSWFELCENGRLYPSFHQLGAGTGRFSCSDPNLQQVPRESNFRKLFVAPEGYKLVDCDLSGIELRIMAWLSKDPTMTEAFNNNVDLHKITASKVMGKPVEEITKAERQMAKAVNFGLIYGAGAETLQKYAKATYGVEMSLEEAKKARKVFFDTYPYITKYHRSINYQQPETYYLPGEQAQKIVIRCASGRTRLFDPGNIKFTQAVNHPDQGTGADMIKEALARLYLDTGYRIILTVHDEIVLEVPETEAEQAKETLRRLMIEAGSKYIAPVPVDAEAHVGSTWADCK